MDSFVSYNNVTYFDNFGVEHIRKGIRTFIRNKNITTYIYRIQAYDSIMCGKTLVHSIICSKYKDEDEKLFKEEESIEILKVLGLIENI